MEFKNMSLKSILLISLALFLIGFVIIKFSLAPPTGGHDFSPVPKVLIPDTRSSSKVAEQETIEGGSTPGKQLTAEQDDAAIQQQLDRDRRQQKQTKDLKIKLEQTNLELEQEKALAEINKLKKDNMEAFDEPSVIGVNNLPEIKVDYIGGDSVKKEAILSIGGASYQVKEKSYPLENIQVVSICDSSVTLHFSAPQDLTKTIEYKPE
jgi:hypothetical protein